MRRLLVIALMSVSVLAFAKPKANPSPTYTKGVLLAFDDHPYPQFIGGASAQSSIVVNHHDFHITIAIGDIAYTASTGRHADAEKLILGDPVDAAADDNFLYFKLPNGKTFSERIVQRARYKGNK